jgi:hypothetical protein
MLACNTLRIDSGRGSPVIEYRIQSDHVDSREVCFDEGTDSQAEWRRLTPEQVSSHVMAGTVLARWLRYRMGRRRLLRACGGEAFKAEDQKNSEDRMAA